MGKSQKKRRERDNFRTRSVVIEEPSNVGSLLSVETIGWVLYLLAIAMIPISYFFNGIVTEYYWSKTLWSMLLFPTSLILAIWSAGQRGKLIWRDSYIALPYLVFFLICVASLGWAANIWKGLERGLQISGGFFAFWAGMHYLNSRARLKQVMYLSILVAFCITLYGLMQYAEIFYLPRDQYKNADPSTTIGLTNFVVEYLDVIMALIPILILVEKRTWMKLLLAIQGGIIFYYFLIADNRAGYLALIMEMLFLGVVGSWIVIKKAELIGINRKRYFKAMGLLLALAGVTLVVTPVGEKVISRMSTITNFKGDASIRFRIETWKQCIENVIPDNLMVGVGLANIEVAFPRYYTKFLEGMTLRHNTRVVRSHNDFIQVMVDLGLLGFIPFLWFLWALFRTGKDLYDNLEKRDNFLLFLGLGAGISGFLLNAFFAFPFQVPSSSMNFFLVVILFDRFRYLTRIEHNAPIHDREIDVKGATAALPVALMLSTGVGQVWALNYTFHALTAEVRNKEARVFKRFNKWKETQILMNEAVKNNPHMEGYWYDRAVAYMHFKKFRLALKDLEVTAKLVPNYGMGRKQIGVLAAQLGETKLALSEFQAALRIFKSQRKELMKLMADTAIRHGRASLYLPIAERSFANGFTDTVFYVLYANALAASGKYTQAVDAFKVVEKRSKVFPAKLLANYATALMHAGEMTEAETYFARATMSQPGNAFGWYNYATFLAKKGDTAALKDALKKAIALDPRFRRRALRDPFFASVTEVVRGL